MFFQKPDVIQCLEYLLLPFLFILEKVEVIEAFGNDIVDRRPFVERSHRILEYHLDIPDDEGIQLLSYDARNPFTVEVDLALRGGIYPYDGPADRSLARAGLADQGKGFAFHNVEIDSTDRRETFMSILEGDLEVPYGKNRLAHSITSAERSSL